ncbi:uncharacterized protein LOC100266687 isoform X2 [Vitis vinifera]|uniref:uncharacterized protein LOC100266687 isoform X2 n=1 Tax=Vitis vinifera TaxID=29760 RepID=UPI00053FBDB0|nr:uncharacterized protein LOC100266687 isoform X2 [Vitis vinifera]|eukprot:XP_010650235.1 PREDICTED: uncharacterized protein LOC100266687 isoform X2 [Vitis vinifera]
MKSKNPSIREWDQRSLSSTFLQRSSSSSKDSDQGMPVKSPTKDSHVSLSDFLDRRLHTTSVLPKTVQGKQKPFSSPLGCSNECGSIHGHIGVKKRGEDKANYAIDIQVFKQLKHSRKEKEDFMGSFGVDDIGSFHTNTVPESRKRKDPSGLILHGLEGGISRKHLVVLGGDPKPKQTGRLENFIRNKKPRPLFNHYANGSGWWDCNMEGVDGDEVGCNQAWEGVGSTTLGGLEWH